MRLLRTGSSRRGAVVVSIAAHAILTLAVLRLAPGTLPRGPAEPPLEVSIVHTAAAPTSSAPAPAPTPPAGDAVETMAAAPARPAVPNRSHARAARSHHQYPAAQASIAEPASAASASPSETAPAEPHGAPAECPPLLVPIDPFSVAARAITDEARANGSLVTGTRVAGRQPDLEGALRRGVAGPDLSERPPPPIRPRGDGSYDVEGNRLAARIFPDGRIAFDDGPAFEDPSLGFIPGDRASGTPGGIGVGLRFDLNDGLFGAAGQDPLRPEREYLMRHTEALRTKLANRARRVDEERGIMALEERLREIAATRSMTPAAQRQAIFDVWDDCATDAIGARARGVVEAFVRQHYPMGTPLAYSAAELTRYNQARTTGPAFDPYGTPGA